MATKPTHSREGHGTDNIQAMCLAQVATRDVSRARSRFCCGTRTVRHFSSTFLYLWLLSRSAPQCVPTPRSCGIFLNTSTHDVLQFPLRISLRVVASRLWNTLLHPQAVCPTCRTFSAPSRRDMPSQETESASNATLTSCPESLPMLFMPIDVARPRTTA